MVIDAVNFEGENEPELVGTPTIKYEFFRNAEYRFSRLEEVAMKSDNDGAEIEPSDMIHMLAASFSVAKLRAFSKEELIRLENLQIVHPSTISGGSLSIAFLTLQDYLLDGKQTFSRDQYEQLWRSCYSARHLYEKGYF